MSREQRANPPATIDTALFDNALEDAVLAKVSGTRKQLPMSNNADATRRKLDLCISKMRGILSISSL